MRTGIELDDGLTQPVKLEHVRSSGSNCWWNFNDTATSAKIDSMKGVFISHLCWSFYPFYKFISIH